jgi:ATP-dependent RNA helicase DeaD
VAALVKEVGVERTRIGKIEVRESFSLVEVPAAEAGPIAERLSGVTIRRRRATARLDRGARTTLDRARRAP